MGSLPSKDELMHMADQARANAYCPYSGYAVGAALLCKDGTIVTGCNVENAAFGPGNCAERTAIFSAVAQGKRDFMAIAIAGGKKGQPQSECYPCGICRQVMSEFCEDDFQIICRNSQEENELFTMSEILPRRFKL